jgi:hypothetical protein
MVNLRTWIKHEFGSQAKLEEELGLGPKTLTRWLKSSPRMLLTHLPYFTARGYSCSEVLRMVQRHEDELDYLTGRKRTFTAAKRLAPLVRDFAADGEEAPRRKEGGRVEPTTE